MYIKCGNILKLAESNTFNLKQYKYAKFHIEKLEAILILIDTSLRGFELFTAYSAAFECETTLKTQKILVEALITKYRKILKSKGKQ